MGNRVVTEVRRARRFSKSLFVHVDFDRWYSTRKCRETVSTTCLCHFWFDGGSTMKRRFLAGGLVTILTLSLSAASQGDDKSAPKPPAPPTNAALEKMKKLAGTWLLA